MLIQQDGARPRFDRQARIIRGSWIIGVNKLKPVRFLPLRLHEVADVRQR